MLHNKENKIEKETVVITQASAKRCVYLLAKNNECKTLAELLNTASISDFNETFGNKKTALHIAAEKGSKDAVALLLQHRDKLRLNLEDKDGLTALDLTRQYKHLEIEELLLRYGARSGSRIRDEDYFSGRILPPKFKNYRGFDWLKMAQESNHNVDSNAALIFILAENDEDKTLAELISGMDSLNKTFTGGKTVLHAAVQKNSLKALAVLLSPSTKEKIDLNISDAMGNTAAHIAVALNNKAAIEALFTAKADFKKENKEGLTPLMMAGINGDEAVFKFLSQHLTQEDFAQTLSKVKEITKKVTQAQEAKEKPVPLASTPQALFSPFPDCVQALAKETGINPEELKVYYDANDGRYLRLEKLQWYIRNNSDIQRSPTNRLSKKEVLALSDQEFKNLMTLKYLVMRGVFSVDKVKSFTEPEREFLDSGYFYRTSHESIFEQLEEFREEQRKSNGLSLTKGS